MHVPMTTADRYLWTLPMFHANGWTFVWTVTAVGATHVCLRKVEPVGGLRADGARIHLDALRRADRPHQPGQRARDAPPERQTRRTGRDGWRPAGGRHHRASRRRARLDRDAGLRADRDRAVHHGVRAEAGARRAPACRAGRDQGAPGRRADHVGRDTRRRFGRTRGSARRRCRRRDHRAGERGDGGLLQRSRGHGALHGGRLVPHRRRRGRPPGRLPGDPRID